MRALVFYELLGLSKERSSKAWRDWLLWHRDRNDTPSCRAGLSTHAPYSVAIGLIRSAARNGYRLAIHLAETRAELELLAHHTGPFRTFLEELGVWAPEGLAKSVDEVIWRSSRAPSVLYVHANFLAPGTWIPPHGTVVYCPRTHAAFGHPPHPFRDFLRRGIRVALGTDSLASNPDLDVLAEMRFVHQRHPDISGDLLLRMSTLSGAEALGWADETGSLTPGKSADLVVVPLPNQEGTPHELLLTSSQPVARTLFRGQWA
jgi:aminodeoxyfutalosine deaminase